MFLIIYLDYFHLYMPSKIEDILRGRVFVFDITKGFLLAALALVTIPALMISTGINYTEIDINELVWKFLSSQTPQK
jgi:hypothetical protein